MTSSSQAPALSYCAAQVRRHDRGRYLCTLLAPAAHREALFALYAFDHEITKVAAVVSQPMTGLIRLQWWRDALEGITAGAPVAHPVVVALHDRLGRDLPRALLDQAIDGREHLLEAEPLASLAALEDRLMATHASIVQAALGLLGVDQGATRDAARHVGIALGLVEVVYRWDAEQLPPEISTADLARCAHSHLDAARWQRHDLPRQALAALLPARLAEDDLGRLARAGYDPSVAPLQGPRAMAPLRLLWCGALGRF